MIVGDELDVVCCGWMEVPDNRAECVSRDRLDEVWFGRLGE
jgi:hypothetical protein